MFSQHVAVNRWSSGAEISSVADIIEYHGITSILLLAAPFLSPPPSLLLKSTAQNDP